MARLGCVKHWAEIVDMEYDLSWKKIDRYWQTTDHS